MKKKLLVLVLALVCLTVLTGCFCNHETWKDATCLEPKTCADCGKTEGEPLGHVWLAATCETPKTCEQCGLTEGEAKGHDLVEATCTEAKHCVQCDLTEGEPLGHTWQEATTEAPKTCLTCGLTEGERIITDPRFTTAAAADLIGRWGMTMNLNGEMMGLPDFTGELPCTFIVNFGNAGDLSMEFELGDEEAFMSALVDYVMQTAYQDLAAQGINKEAADAAIQATYGMTMEEYARSMLGDMDFAELINSIFSYLNGVYYVEGDQLYSGNNWDAPMESDSFSISGDTLHIEGLEFEPGVETIFTRVTE